MHLDTKNNRAAGFQGPVKIELRKGAGLLHIIHGPTLDGCTCIDQRGPADIIMVFIHNPVFSNSVSNEKVMIVYFVSTIISPSPKLLL